MRSSILNPVSCARRFVKNSSGHVALMFSMSALVLVGLAGGVVDYSSSVTAQSNYQAAADSAALAATIAYRNENWSTARNAGIKAFNNNIKVFDRIHLTDLKINKLDGDIKAVRVVAKGKNKNYFLGLFGLHDMKFNVESIARYPDYPVEVSLALDNTFSMSVDNKIGDLKNAARGFVDTLLEASDDNVKISIVPFSRYVNVGVDKMGESWLDAKDQVVNVPEHCTTSTPLISKSGCTTTTTFVPPHWVPESCTAAQYNDGVETSPASCTPGHMVPGYNSTSESCTNYEYGPPVETCTPAHSYTISWNGCVASRNYPLNLKDESFNVQVPGPNQLTCPSEITPLSDDVSTLRSAIDNMVTVGDTYIPQGVVWAARTLSKQAPYSEAISDAERASKRGKRYLVLMTDGINTVSPHVPTTPLHDQTDTAKSDTWLTEACANAKNDDIIVFTISFGTGVDPATKSLLQSCATNSSYYYDATSGGSLQSSFDRIAGNILAVFLSK